MNRTKRQGNKKTEIPAKSTKSFESNKGLNFLTALAQASPVLVQLSMIILMGMRGNWLYATLLTPSLLASITIQILQIYKRKNKTDRNDSIKSTPPLHQTSWSTHNKDDLRHQLDIPPPGNIEDILPGSDAVTHGGCLWQGIVRQWLLHSTNKASRLSNNLEKFCVNIGSTHSGPFQLNLPVQGPHALVAGTTGSGKSVLLQDWCLALASKLSPADVNFVFLDFKGGSAFNHLSLLPHTVGSVSDLDLEAAARALSGIERELKRREKLVADENVSSITDLTNPPARLVVVIDEFQALRQQLPDYMDHLVQLASLGRSLGMNLIACTQNPMMQISTNMKANINLNISLRVRDEMQSKELLDHASAAHIPPNMPGSGFFYDGEHMCGFRCAHCKTPELLVKQILIAAKFLSIKKAKKLFTPPLPAILSAQQQNKLSELSHWNRKQPSLAVGLTDNGVSLGPCVITLNGNIAIIGPGKRGKSNLLTVFAHQLKYVSQNQAICPPCHLKYTVLQNGKYKHKTWELGAPQSTSNALPDNKLDPKLLFHPPTVPQLIWCIDQADKLLDPINQEPIATELQEELSNSKSNIILVVESIRHLRHPERFQTQIIFPSGQRSEDLMAGIPSKFLDRLGDNASAISGRAVLIQHGQAQLIQCSQSKIS